LEEEVYIEQFEGFVEPRKNNIICKLYKALYGSKKYPGVWYERLHIHLVKIGSERTNDNSILYLKSFYEKMRFLAEIFVDNIIFGGQDSFYKLFTNYMKKESDISMLSEIKFFVSLQVYQMNKGIYTLHNQSISRRL
jgi:hypothetical protein